MIIVLAGTSEGREIAVSLQEAGYAVLASVTSELGEQILIQQGVENILQGNLRREKLIQLLKSRQCSLLVDATHPFARVISKEAMEAADLTGVPYIRFERAPSILPDDPLIIQIDQLDRLDDFINPGMTIFSTMGSKSLGFMVPLVREKRANLIARVLPCSASLKTCEDLGLGPDQIVAMKGPYSREMNRALFHEYRAELVVSKESGRIGGLEAKVQAALDLHIPIIVWIRPLLQYPVVFQSASDLITHINNILGRC